MVVQELDGVSGFRWWIKIPPRDTGLSSNFAGFSTEIALLGTVKRNFEFGFVGGTDIVSESEKWDNNKKSWFAFAVGFKFSDITNVVDD
ncbi:hypothetical protein [Vibrio alfacsensis]|uniref:hypothetical protein n=1 Tax=Vibrio alfacsensis TaxID=1074311 RepID=UPI0040696BE8